MKMIKWLLLVLFYFGVTTNINAQLLKKLKNKVAQKVEQKIEEKIDKETDKVIDDALDGKKEQTTEDLPSTFSFTSSLEVEITTNNDNSATIEILLGNYTNIYAMSVIAEDMDEQTKIYNVVSPKSTTMFLNVAGMKMKKTVDQDAFSTADFSDKVPANSEELQKTGATKSILGYSCYEYKYVNEGGYVKVWATKDFPSKNKNISMLGMRENSIIEGFVLELETKSGNEIAKMKAVKFNKNKAVTINTNEYKSM
ncbi:DUF4412 domain-containing protein [uncultured Polaribacter sp.]|uniref:DUF4412 domain-containing protein n=1 Tax=uncultured Polaribacter sp. TaxID=174711 RepID=UPI0030DC5AFF